MTGPASTPATWATGTPDSGRMLDEATSLLRRLIRHGCVNDGTPDSGQETRSAALLADYLEGSGLDLEIVEPRPGRGSLIATLPGTAGPYGGLSLLGHLDVVPADPAGWTRDPFAADLVDGIVWGRGAVDMLGITATMAVALKHLAQSGHRPERDLTLLAVADEEAGGHWGAGWLAEHRPELFRDRSVITESGGFPIPTPDGTAALECFVGEKGAYPCTLVVQGTSGHGAFPYRTDNAVVKAAEVLRRLSGLTPAPQLDDTWREYVDGLGHSGDLRRALLDPAAIDEALAAIPLGLARHFHAVTRMTVSPNTIQGGTKPNVVPDRVDISLDIRVMPGQTREEVEALLHACLDGVHGVRPVFGPWRPGSASARHTPLWDALERVTSRLAPNGRIVPAISSAATDARHVRPAGSVCYGYGLFTDRIASDDYFTMFHGVDERIDQGSLRLMCDLWTGLAHEFTPAAPPAAAATPALPEKDPDV
ncbi:M20/M25/M40 family metallo-hydrolase [Streptomyces sp. G45]|uniref:M20/M25/M40 family metallo-hydrolase n=1 Tax=Streptomyces sp. G45 TaxID=3406627 RepID=UPI003C14FB0C